MSPTSGKAVVLGTHPWRRPAMVPGMTRPLWTTAPLPPASLLFIPTPRSPEPRQEAPARTWEGSGQRWTGLDLAPTLLGTHAPTLTGAPGPLLAWGRTLCPPAACFRSGVLGRNKGQGDGLHLDTGRRHHPNHPSRTPPVREGFPWAPPRGLETHCVWY